MKSPRDTTRLTSFILRIFWYLYPILTGRTFRMSDIHSEKNKRIAKDLIKTFLPELQRMTADKPPKRAAEKAKE